MVVEISAVPEIRKHGTRPFILLALLKAAGRRAGWGGPHGGCYGRRESGRGRKDAVI